MTCYERVVIIHIIHPEKTSEKTTFDVRFLESDLANHSVRVRTVYERGV